MTAIRCPKIAALKQSPVGPLLGDMLEAAGVTDADFPDIIRDDADYTDPTEVERDMPVVFAKLSAKFGGAS
jgi:hypothetical protein